MWTMDRYPSNPSKFCRGSLRQELRQPIRLYYLQGIAGRREPVGETRRNFCSYRLPQLHVAFRTFLNDHFPEWTYNDRFWNYPFTNQKYRKYRYRRINYTALNQFCSGRRWESEWRYWRSGMATLRRSTAGSMPMYSTSEASQLVFKLGSSR